MEFTKGLQTTGYPYKTENGSWIRAINAILNDDAKSVSNERGMLSIKEDNYFFLGSITADNGIFLFEQQIRAPFPNSDTKFRITYLDLTNPIISAGSFNILLDTQYITYDVENSLTVIEGEFTYNKDNDRIIAWSGGTLYPSTSLVNIGIGERNFCVLNVDNMPFIHGVDSVTHEINGISGNSNNEHLLIFQNPTIKEAMYEIKDVAFGGGVLKSGVYYIGIRYVYPDGDKTNITSFTKAITITPGSKVVMHSNMDGGIGGELTGKSIILNISNLDNRYSKFEIVVYSIIQGVHKAYSDNTISFNVNTIIPELSEVVLISGLNFHEISIDEVLIDTVYINKVNAIDQFQNQLILGNIEEDEVIDLQTWALGIKTEWIYEDWISLDGRKGSYKDELTIFDLKGFMPGETMALYVAGILHNGKRTPAVHIPGRVVEDWTFDGVVVGKENDNVADTTVSNEVKLVCSAIDVNYKPFHSFPQYPFNHRMGYWENQNEYYPEDIRFSNTILGIDLRPSANSAPVKVRHHKFPEQKELDDYTTYGYDDIPHSETGVIEVINFHVIEPTTYSWASHADSGDDWWWSLYYSAEYHTNDTSVLVSIKTLIDTYRYGIDVFNNHISSGCVNWANCGADDPCPLCKGIVIQAIEYVKVDLTAHILGVINAYASPMADPYLYPTRVRISITVLIRKHIAGTVDWCTTHPTTLVDILNFETMGYYYNDYYTIQDNPTDPTPNISESIILSPGEAISIMVIYRTAVKNTDWNQTAWETIALNKIYNGLTYASTPVSITVTKLDSTIGTGTIYSKVLGLRFTDIILPKSYRDKIQSLEFYYAKRTTETATRIEDVTVLKNENNSFIELLNDDNRVHPFDLFQNGIKKVPISYILPITESHSTKLWENPTISNITTIDVPLPIQGSVFRPGHNTIVKPDNQYTEENMYIGIKPIIRSGTLLTYKAGLIGALSTFRNNIYLPFDKQELVSTGYKLLINDDNFIINGDYIESDDTILTNVYGGDTYYNMQGTYIKTDNNPYTNVDVMYQPIHSMSNIALRMGDDHEDIYYPRNDAVSVETIRNLLSLTHGSAVPTDWKYNIDYSSLNNIKCPLPYTTTFNYLSNHPYKIIRSEQQSIEEYKLKWRELRPASYYEMDKEKGQIISLGVMEDNLIINMRSTSFIAKIKDVLLVNAENINTYLGKGDLFDREPVEIMTSANGYAGCSHSNSTLSTRVGYIFIDSTRYRLFLFTGKDLMELNNIGVKSLIDTLFENYPTLADDILHNNGIAIAYDEKSERLLFNFHVLSTKINKSKTPLDKYPTLSFDLGNKRWISYHNINVSSFIQGRNRLFGVINNITLNSFITESKYFELNKNEYGLYNGALSRKSFSIDILFNNAETLKDIYESIVWEVEIINKSVLDTENDRFNYDKSITGIVIYNDTQCSEIMEINKSNDVTNLANEEWYDETDGRNNNGVWSFNDFRDAVVDNNLKFFDYSKDLTTNVDNSLKDWYDNSTFIGKFIVIRLIFNNEPITINNELVEYNLKLNNINVNKRKSYK